MVSILLRYEGDLRCSAVHGPSSTRLHTDAPVDNQGRGESFSPTDLLATSLGTCVLTIMGIRARDLGVDLVGARVQVEKHMAADPHRRIARIDVRLDLPEVPDAARGELERAGLGCPVKHSIDPRIEVEIDFGWGRVSS
ncbi:MAG: OsmC family protein [Planctomycetota bacterium]|jgi:putative redox protein